MTNIYPVIHILDEEQVIRNVKIASEAKASGVFLINHNHDNSISAEDLIRFSIMAKKLISWVGINCLNLTALEAMKMVPPEIDGLWTDDAFDQGWRSKEDAASVQDEKARRSWQGTYFGGVAFKYQAPVSDVATAAAGASAYMDVVTTSGTATGKPPSLDKIKKMRQAMPPGSRLAIASGITPENIEQYLPYTTDFLVATGISNDFYNLDPEKLQDLLARIPK